MNEPRKSRSPRRERAKALALTALLLLPSLAESRGRLGWVIGVLALVLSLTWTAQLTRGRGARKARLDCGSAAAHPNGTGVESLIVLRNARARRRYPSVSQTCLKPHCRAG